MRKIFKGHKPGRGHWCAPWEAGLDSEAKAVARRLGEILTALGSLTDGHVKGSLPSELREARLELHDALTEAGWRIKARATSGWTVLPPKREGR